MPSLRGNDSPLPPAYNRLMTQTIGIIGTGALGTLMAWHWRQTDLYAARRSSDNPPFVILTGDDLHEFQAMPWQGEPLDWLVVCTKASDALEALQQRQAWLGRVDHLLLLQNGMGQQQQVADWLARQPLAPTLWAAVSTEGAYRTETGLVVYAGKGHTHAGRWSESDIETTVALPPGVLPAADIRERMLAKLAINAIINPLTGYYRCHNGELLTEPDRRRHFERLSEEVADFYRLQGWCSQLDIRQQALSVAEATARNKSSTLQDILAGRPNELPYICGYLLAEAARNRHDLPVTQDLYQQLTSGA